MGRERSTGGAGAWRNCLLALIGAVIALAGLTPSGAAHAGPRYGIIVAEKDYRSSSLPEVKYAKSDAALMREVFEKALGIPSENIAYYPDSPTMNELQGLFGRDDGPGRMGSSISAPDAELYVYYVGHGSKEMLDVTNTMRGYLLANDSNATDLFNSAYSYDQLLDNLETLRSGKFPEGHVYLFMESCFSGRTQEGELLASNTMASLGHVEVEDRPGISIISAATSEQYSYWDDELKHGIFTFYLAAGLTGRADGAAGGAKDGAVTLPELGRYLAEKVRERAAAVQKGREQTPEVAGTDDGAALAEVPETPPVIRDLAQRAFVEKALLKAYLSVDPATLPPAKFAETRQRLEAFRRGCFSCEDDQDLKAYLDKIAAREVACQGERELYRSLASASLFEQLKQSVQSCDPKSGCCEAQVSFKAQGCAASGSLDSEACKCLDDDTCLDAAVVDPACSEKFAAAKAAALSGMSLQPLSDYQRDYAHCGEAAGLAEAQAELCKQAAAAAGEDAQKLQSFVAGMGACPEVAEARERLKKAECGTAWSQVEASPGDDALLASFLADRQDCTETEAATRELERRVDAAWAASQADEQGQDYKSATRRLDAVLETFGTHIGEQQRARLEERLSRLQTLAVGTECEAAFNQARRSGQGAELKRFVADNPACAEQAGKAQDILTRCITPYERLAAAGDPDQLQDYARTAIDTCPQQAALAAQQAEALKQGSRETCAADWRSVRYSADPGDLYGFIADHASCADEASQAEAALDDLFSACVSGAASRAAISYDAASAAYDRCMQDFGRTPRYREEVANAIANLAPPTPAPTPTPAPQPQNLTEYYYVGPVAPPDPWLALRTEPSTRSGQRIAEMPEGTLFQKIGQSGKWMHVRLRDGTEGWAHSGWILCCEYLPN